MSSEDEFEKLIDNLDQCLRQARALKLQHAVHVLKMAVMEVADRSIEHSGNPPPATKSSAHRAARREL
jgi:hypothetical protein